MLRYTKNPQVEQINLRIFRTPLVFLLLAGIYSLIPKEQSMYICSLRPFSSGSILRYIFLESFDQKAVSAPHLIPSSFFVKMLLKMTTFS